MRKVLLCIGIFSAFIPFVSLAKCFDKQFQRDIPLKINILENKAKAGGDHGYMDEIIIKTPAKIDDIPLSRIQITKGEVAEFWIPLHYTINNNMAIAILTGHKNSLRNFEVEVFYHDGNNCHNSLQTMIYKGEHAYK